MACSPATCRCRTRPGDSVDELGGDRALLDDPNACGAATERGVQSDRRSPTRISEPSLKGRPSSKRSGLAIAMRSRASVSTVATCSPCLDASGAAIPTAPPPLGRSLAPRTSCFGTSRDNYLPIRARRPDTGVSTSQRRLGQKRSLTRLLTSTGRFRAFPTLSLRAPRGGFGHRAPRKLGVRSGLPIILGAADSVLGTYAVGARQSGEISYLAGTSTVILGVSEEVVRDRLERCIVTALQDTNGIGLEMDLLSTGSALAWLSNVLGLAQVSDLVPLAASADPATSPVFLPYLAPGEQGALWDSAATAAVVGVHLGHNREDIARALLSGLVIESRRCLGVLDELIGSSGTLYLSGPTASGPPFVQDLADATGREIVVCDPGVAGHSALGAAIFAAGVIDESWPQPSAERVATVQPDPAQAEVWRGLVARHESARVALSGQ